MSKSFPREYLIEQAIYRGELVAKDLAESSPGDVWNFGFSISRDEEGNRVAGTRPLHRSNGDVPDPVGGLSLHPIENTECEEHKFDDISSPQKLEQRIDLELVFEEERGPVKLKAITFEGEVEGSRCSRCQAVAFDGNALQSFDREVAQAIAELETRRRKIERG